jgi:5-methylcytosine-specific restriction endonuclease McrA
MKLRFVLLLLFIATLASGQTKVREYHRKDGTYVSGYTRRSRTEQDNYSVPRTNNGTTRRSASARSQFLSQTTCPSTGQTGRSCPGYVVDHIKPLACGGADDPSNMQFQTIEDGKAKDKWERKDCGK